MTHRVSVTVASIQPLITSVDVSVFWRTPWTSDWMKTLGKQKLACLTKSLFHQLCPRYANCLLIASCSQPIDAGKNRR